MDSLRVKQMDIKMLTMANQLSVRVMHIVPRLTRGGAETMMLSLIKASPEYIRHEVVSLKRPDAGGEKMAGEIPGFVLKVMNQKRRGDLAMLWRLFRYIKQSRPDVVHCHLFGAKLYGSLAARLAGVSAIVVTEHSTNLPTRGWRKWASACFSNIFFRIIAVSQAVYNRALEAGMPKEKLCLIYNGIDCARFELRKDLNESTNSGGKKVVRLGSIGRLSPEKNFYCLIDALAFLPESLSLRVEIVGEGDLGEELRVYSLQKKQGNKIAFLGRREDIPEFLSSLDLFVLPSLWEGLPLALLEAGAASLPVIASDIPACREIINNEVNGLLFKSGDAEELAEKISRLATDAAVAHRLGKALRANVERNFSLSGMQQAYERVYTEAMARN